LLAAAGWPVAADPRSRIDPARIAVAGQSDGGETALAVAYDRRFLDRRVDAAVILSGSRLPGGKMAFGAGRPPLLATQGTADEINPPSYTTQFFDVVSRPKFLLWLRGASHLPPYSTDPGTTRLRCVTPRAEPTWNFCTVIWYTRARE